MKKFVMTAAALMLSAVLWLLAGREAASADSGMSAAELSDKVERHISLYEYGKAVRLIEQYPDITEGEEFDRSKNALLIHFTEVAYEYFMETEKFIVRRSAYGDEPAYDKNGNISPYNFKEHLTHEALTAIDRVTITNQIPEGGKYPCTTVKIKIFGKYAVYPPEEDITLDKRTKVTNKYTDSTALLYDVETNMGLYRYMSAVKLMEENPRLSAEAEFDDVKAELYVYMTKKARLFYTHTVTHVTKQEVMGYTLDDGCEGYDPKNRTLDPGALSYLCGAEEKRLSERVTVICTNETVPEFKVSIRFCGKTACYPANDVKL